MRNEETYTQVRADELLRVFFDYCQRHNAGSGERDASEDVFSYAKGTFTTPAGETLTLTDEPHHIALLAQDGGFIIETSEGHYEPVAPQSTIEEVTLRIYARTPKRLDMSAYDKNILRHAPASTDRDGIGERALIERFGTLSDYANGQRTIQALLDGGFLVRFAATGRLKRTRVGDLLIRGRK